MPGHAALALTAGFLFLLNLALVWPGIMTWDSNNQYGQAISGHFNDWFPPIMAVLWRQLLPLFPWGTGFLTLHLALWWGSLLTIALALRGAGKAGAAWAMLASGALPNMLFLNSFVLKDVSFTAATMMAFAVIFAHRLRSKPISAIAWLAVIALLVYAALVRQNGIFAVAPLVCYGAMPRRLSRPIPLTAATAFISLIVIALSPPINHHLFRAQDWQAKRSIILFDLTGIAHWSRDPAVFGRTVNPTLAMIDRCYTPALWDEIGLEPCKTAIEPDYVPARKVLKAIYAHPIAYAEHRLAHWNRELFFWAPVDRWQWGDAKSLPDEPSGRFEAAQESALSVISNLPLFSPALAFVVLIVLMIDLMVRQDRLDEPHLGMIYLGAGALSYTIGYLLIGVANMYRYQQFLWCACSTILIIYVAFRGRRAPAENRFITVTLCLAAVSVLAVTSVARLTL